MRRFTSRLAFPEIRRSRRRLSRLGLLSLLAFVFALASCGTETATELTAEDTSDTAAEPAEPAEDASTQSAEPAAETEEAGPVVPDEEEVVLGNFPSVDVANVGTGETVNLQQTLSGGDTPILLWFYAPH